MINNENTYNNVFKNKVVVGSINPLDYKTNFTGKSQNVKEPKVVKNVISNNTNINANLNNKTNISMTKK